MTKEIKEVEEVKVEETKEQAFIREYNELTTKYGMEIVAQVQPVLKLQVKEVKDTEVK